MTELALSAILGTVLSLIFTFVPGLRTWFEGLTSEQKAQFMAVGIVLIAVGVVALSCTGFISALVCTQATIMSFATGTVVNAILALVANQSVHSLAKNFAPKE
jgi:hypothetical protein